MSFSAIRKVEQPEHDDQADGPTEAEIAAAAAAAAPQLVEAIAPAAEPAASVAATGPTAPASFDDELGSIAVDRDIHIEAVAPPTRTEAEAEKAASEPVGGDPAVAGEAPAAATETSAAQSGEAAATETSATETSEEDKPFTLDEEELRGYGIHASVIATIAGMRPEDARDVVAEIRAKHADIEDARQRKKDAAESAAKHSGGGGGLFSAVAQMFAPPSPESRAIKQATKEIDAAQAYLSNDSIRDRVHRMRRQEIVDAANGLSSDARRLSAASQSFNDAVRATPAGQAIETEIASIMELHPRMSRNDIISAAKDGSLAAKIGEDTLTPHVRAAFEDPAVRAAWDSVSAVGDTIEKRGATLTERLNAYEEHFPGATDADRLRETMDDAMKGLENTFKEPMAEDPDAPRKLSERLAKLAKMIAEMFEKLLAKLGFGPKP